MSPKELQEHLTKILDGDWQTRDKLIYYFMLDKRLYTPNEKLDPEKEELKKKCFDEVSRAAKAEKPNPFAVAFLGFLYENGIGVIKDSLKANELYRSDKEHENPWAQNWRGDRYSRRADREINPTKKKELKETAKAYYKYAAAKHFPPAQFSLSKIYEEAGRAKEKIKYLKLALDQNEPRALNAVYIKNGKGNPFDLYIPINKRIECVCINEIQRIVKNGKVVSYTTTSYKVTVSYSAPNSAQKVLIFEDSIPGISMQDFEKGLSLAKFDLEPLKGIHCLCNFLACLCKPKAFKNRQDGERIAELLSAVPFENALAKIIERADNIITNNLKQAAQSSATGISDSSPANQSTEGTSGDTEIKIAAEQNGSNTDPVPSPFPLLFDYTNKIESSKIPKEHEGLVVLPGQIREFESGSISLDTHSRKTTVLH